MAASDVEHFWISEADLLAALRSAAEARGLTVGALARDILFAWMRNERVRQPRAEMTALRLRRRASR